MPTRMDFFSMSNKEKMLDVISTIKQTLLCTNRKTQLFCSSLFPQHVLPPLPPRPRGRRRGRLRRRQPRRLQHRGQPGGGQRGRGRDGNGKPP